MRVTDTAAQLLKELRDQTGAPPELGVRLEPAPDPAKAGQLGLVFTDSPQPDDEVIEQSELQVFVPHEVATTLADRTLDVEPTPQGPVLMLK